MASGWVSSLSSSWISCSGDASCHVLGTFKQPCGGPVVKNWRPVANSHFT